MLTVRSPGGRSDSFRRRSAREVDWQINMPQENRTVRHSVVKSMVFLRWSRLLCPHYCGVHGHVVVQTRWEQ
eukprot:3099317-Pyramimonas_sp.AAC.2